MIDAIIGGLRFDRDATAWRTATSSVCELAAARSLLLPFPCFARGVGRRQGDRVSQGQRPQAALVGKAVPRRDRGTAGTLTRGQIQPVTQQNRHLGT